ncbi:MAG: RNA-directed DNA polymerase [Leptolyngbyaceae cyanobacterium SL_5_9]|nr:RNA-directed DNA polymerase [Leptolyngbyaceae cyanobacterium SL_5_9]NJO73333.1 RNA-directed DNA polymerase [Leptolyngbyaceae cyanobacterium RM1_406_9]
MLSSNELWNKFSNYENFLLAWQRTVNVTSRMVHEKLGMQIFAYNLQSNLEDLVQQVNSEDFPYSPLADHKVYVPKPSTTLRTMSLMAVPDVIVYQALVNVIADQSHLYLVSHENEHVLGNLYAGSGRRWMLQPWKRQYSRFVERVESLYNIGNSWIASTDIVAFYDTIDHERLINLIRQYCGEDDRFENLFRECLSKWSAHNATSTMGRGIPQGSNASDLLANLYLHEIDCKIISSGYHYVRYVDDVRILGADKSAVQQGLILFDLELKCAGLVAQVSKTSVHKIEDIKKEISRLKFVITDPTGRGDYILLETPSPPTSEQAGSVESLVGNTPSEQTDFENNEPSRDSYTEEEEDPSPNNILDVDTHKSGEIQEQLRSKFLESFDLLNDPERGKEAESHLTFCLYRLESHVTLRTQGISLLSKLPWRSEAVSAFLGRFKNDPFIIEELREFISEHTVYSWHRANILWTLYKVSTANNVASQCREWLANENLDWYARTIAARILAEVPSQHSYLIECLKKEQNKTSRDTEATSILRQELAYGAFQRIKSSKKQLALLQLICLDQSPILHRLAVYLLQHPKCKVNWIDLKPYHKNLSTLSALIERLGLSDEVSKPCFIAETMTRTYQISLSETNLRLLYAKHYDKAVETLRESVIYFQKSPSLYVSSFHQFTHTTLIAFYEYVFPSEGGILNSYYHDLIHRKSFKEKCPVSVSTWERLNELRNRVDHPIDKKTQSHSKKITVQEIEFLHKQIEVALQEIFDFWLSVVTSEIATANPNVSAAAVETMTETIEAIVTIVP